MNQLPPLMRDQRQVDAEHLRLLAIFHFVFAGLALAGLGFLGLHYGLMHSVMDNPEMWKNSKGGPPPAEFFQIFRWFYVIFGAAMIACAVLNLLSGIFIRKRIYRTFSIIIAALDCLQMPFGTMLGVFTLVVLLRESVREAYAAMDPKHVRRAE
jgi:hypothetical protein